MSLKYNRRDSVTSHDIIESDGYNPIEPSEAFYADKLASGSGEAEGELTKRRKSHKNSTKRHIAAMVGGATLFAGGVYKAVKDGEHRSNEAKKTITRPDLEVKSGAEHNLQINDVRLSLNPGETNYTLAIRASIDIIDTADSMNNGSMVYDIEIPTMSSDFLKLSSQLGNVKVVKANELSQIIRGQLEFGVNHPRYLDFLIIPTRNNENQIVLTKTVKIKNQTGQILSQKTNKRITGIWQSDAHLVEN